MGLIGYAEAFAGLYGPKPIEEKLKMNERIRELAEQAGLRFTQLMSNPMVPVVDGKETDLEKFAELIVRECAELSVNSQYANTKSEYYEGFNEALVYAGNKIRKHFGVEE